MPHPGDGTESAPVTQLQRFARSYHDETMSGLISERHSVESGAPAVIVRDEERPRHRRSPSDLLRLLAALAVAVIGFTLASGLDDVSAGVALDTIDGFDNVPRPLVVSFILAVQLLAWALPIAGLALLLWQRRYRRGILVVVAAAAAGSLAWLVDSAVVSRFRPPNIDLPVPSWICSGLETAAGHGVSAGTSGDIVDVARDPLGAISGITSFACVPGDGFPNAVYIAAFVAGFSVLTPWLSRRWRRAGWITIAAFLVVRVIDGVVSPMDSLFIGAVAYCIGAGTLLAAGGPDRTPLGRDIADALTRSGLELREIGPADVLMRSAIPYEAVSLDGRRLFVKVFTPDQRAAAFMYRAIRTARFTGLGDERPFSSLRRGVEHEAALSLKAVTDGVRTPRLATTAEVGSGSMLLAYDFIDGRTLAATSSGGPNDKLLDAIWEQVAVMQSRRLAHRNLNASNIVIDPDDEPWVTDFGFAELAASDGQLRADVAQLLASTSVLVGAERAVSAAVRALGTDSVGAAATLLQPAALGSATRELLKRHKGLLDDLNEEIKSQTGLESIAYQRLERVRAKTIVTAVMLGLAFYLLIPQLAEVDLARIADANWWWVIPAALASLVTYVGSALSMMGGVPEQLSLVSTFLVQVASSFFNRITPAKVGGMAANIRYLQKAGVESGVAVAGVGLSNIAGIAVHVLLLVIFIATAGRSTPESLPLPSGEAVLIGLVVVLTLAGVVMLLPWGRRVFLNGLLPVLKEASTAVVAVAQSPGKVALLVGGSLITTISYIFALWYSLEAFGNGLDFVKVATVYLAGSAVAQAAPTPGGIGAAEAALIAGLTAFGLSTEVAVPGVFLYRLVTFWLPVAPGYLGYRKLAAAGAL